MGRLGLSVVALLLLSVGSRVPDVPAPAGHERPDVVVLLRAGAIAKGTGYTWGPGDLVYHVVSRQVDPHRVRKS